MTRATLWKDGEVLDLGTLGGYESFVVSAGNNRGQMAGSATNAIPDAFSGFGTQLRASCRMCDHKLDSAESHPGRFSLGERQDD
jgi:hypothetical protein